MKPTLGVILSALLVACGSDGDLPEAPADPAAASPANCEAAFDQIEVGVVGRLESNVRALDATIEQCPSAEVWIEMAGAQLPELDLSDAEAFLDARCTTNEDLAETVLCQDG